jgi:hypothetical protein
VVVLRKPAWVKNFTQTWNSLYDEVSPFMFKKRVKTETFDHIERTATVADQQMVFANSWNLKQVLVVEGTIPITKRLESIVKDIKASDLIPKVIMNLLS